MRYMMLLSGTSPSTPPPPELFEAIMKLGGEATEAGVLLDTAGLLPSAAGARVALAGGKVTVTDGPFAESKELIGGFWILQTKSKAEVIEWVKRVPFDSGEEIEIRQISEAADFEPAIKTPEGAATLAAETAFRAKQAKR